MPSEGRPKRPRSGSRKGKPRKSVPPRTPFQHIVELVRWVDLVIEVLDARLPASTRHPNAAAIFGNKPRLIVLAKEDLADRDATLASVGAVAGEIPVMMLSLKQAQGKQAVVNAVLDATREKQEALKRKGILERPMRVCVVGLPNVGKSSLINWLIGKKRTRVGNRPGITQGTQWVRVHPRLELLDTPGILPPVEFEPGTASRLAMLNLLPEGKYDAELVAQHSLSLMIKRYPGLMERYVEGITGSEDPLTRFAEARNLLTSGARPDLKRAASLYLSDLRDGRIGAVTLDV